MSISVNERIALLRSQMENAGVDAYIIPSEDPHQSEYVAEYWECRKWISGFTGSAGVAVVTHDHAGVWTDSRYFLQAEKELANSEFQLHKVIKQNAPQHIDWLSAHLAAGSTVGIDEAMFSISKLTLIKSMLSDQEITLKSTLDLITPVWNDRPPLPTDYAIEHDLTFAGKSRADKIKEVRDQMQKGNRDAYLISTLDDIAWLLNIRGRDVIYNPVLISYVIVEKDRVLFFVNTDKIPLELSANLERDHVILQDYNSILDYLKQLADSNILIHKASCNGQLINAITNADIQYGDNIVMHMKAIKNETELQHMRDVMIKDGAALCKMYIWLENELKSRAVPEAELADRLANFRAEQDNYFGESFGAIVGYKGNGAIVHYHATHEDCAEIKNEGMLLLDSGGQYFDGTTDITRTISFDEPTTTQKIDYTNVLKGHIGLAQAIFPVGTIGGQLDVLARQHLWANGTNYLHGTGHGVGFFLNVHEPPQGFAPGLSLRSNTKLEKGMVTSNEPGYYKEGEYGIRIENLVITVESGKSGFYAFETITLFPIDQSLIEKDMMTQVEIDWLNSYHKMVFEKLSPRLNEAEKLWMKDMCKPI